MKTQSVMKAQVMEAFGDPDVFHEVTLPWPKVRPGHVLIRVEASSINPLDCKIRSGMAKGYCPPFPAILHGDVAGVIEDVGEHVTGFSKGDRVYACAGGVKPLQGAIADYMLADAELVSRMPKNLTFREAAVLPLVTLTAWEGLFDRANLQPGQKVLVHGGTGGVGHVAVQLARWKGAEVFATCSSEEKIRLARELGAHHGINYKTESVQDYVEKYTNGAGFDLVFDTWGFENIDASFEAAKVRGTVVSIMSFSTHDLTPMLTKSLTLHVVNMLMPLIHGIGRAHQGQILKEAAKLVEERHLRPLLDKKAFPFQQLAEAHRYFENGQHIGKVALLRE